MIMQRRKFIKNAALTTGALLLSKFDLLAMGVDDNEKLTILHTNDVHSRLDPFPMDGGRNQGLGGVAARAQLIKEIRAQEANVLLLDAGDIFQGTPYFNFYKGEPEIKAMSAMGYDAATIGNHDFDGGLENLATQIKKGNFALINCNYDCNNTPLENLVQPYKIFNKGKLKIGVTGVGIELKGLVPDNLCANVVYNNPIERLNTIATQLKEKEKCDLIICLSHLGYKYDDKKVSDKILAKETKYIDLIIGGHTHTFMPKPETVTNINGSDVVINQVGFAGINLGRLDFEFTKKNGKNFLKSHKVLTVKKSE
jgi:5'-nucleotidase